MKTNNSIFDTFKEGFDAGFYKRLNGNPALDLYVGRNDSGLYSFEYRGAFTPIKVKCSELILVEQFKHDSFNSICFSLEKDELLERFSIFCRHANPFVASNQTIIHALGLNRLFGSPRQQPVDLLIASQ
jgi:hypothetical protein